MCDTLLLSTYQAIVHCLPYTVLLSMYLSYVLTINPCDFRLFVYRSYHNSADSMQTYKYSNSCGYSTFTKFSTLTFFLCSGFTSHMMSTNSSSIFNMMKFSSVTSALGYAPGTSKMSMYLPLFASIMILVNR